jgi:hypothetical protein
LSITRVKASSITQGLPKGKTALTGNDVILGGSYESIATVTVGTNSPTSVTFSSIPSTYKHLQIRGIARDSRSATWIDTMWLYCNADTTGSNYYSHILYGSGSAAGADANAGVDSYGMPIAVTGATNVTTSFAPFVIDILDYANTSKNKTVRSLHGIEDNTNGQMRLRSGLWMSTAAVNSLTFLGGDAGVFFQQYSSFALYGIN